MLLKQAKPRPPPRFKKRNESPPRLANRFWRRRCSRRRRAVPPGAGARQARLAPTRFLTFGSPRSERDGELPVRVYRPLGYVGRKKLGPIHPSLALEIAHADVVHCHQLHTFLADQCVLYGRALRKPVFLTDHAGGDRHFNHRLHTVDGAAGLLLVSDFNAKGFSRHAPKIRVIHGGVDTDRFQPRPGATRRRAALFAGRLIPYKGIHHLIAAVRPETEVRIVGQAYHDEYATHLKSVAQGRNVHFLGPVHGDTLIDEYSTAGASAMPSENTDLYGKQYPKSEILGLALLEAMACETPVVCSRIGGMPELVVDGETGIVTPPGDEAALGEAIEGLLDDPTRARRMGQAGRKHVLEAFTWDAVARRCLRAYAELRPNR
jgi:glycosyltransferase involved in cell wall biosynthesis